MAGLTEGRGARQPSGVHPIPLTLGVVGLTSGATRASTKAEPAVGDCLIITPALAQALESDW